MFIRRKKEKILSLEKIVSIQEEEDSETETSQREEVRDFDDISNNKRSMTHAMNQWRLTVKIKMIVPVAVIDSMKVEYSLHPLHHD